MTDNQLRTLRLFDQFCEEYPELPARQVTDMVCQASGESYVDVIDAIQVGFNQNGL